MYFRIKKRHHFTQRSDVFLYQLQSLSSTPMIKDLGHKFKQHLAI